MFGWSTTEHCLDFKACNPRIISSRYTCVIDVDMHMYVSCVIILVWVYTYVVGLYRMGILVPGMQLMM